MEREAPRGRAPRLHAVDTPPTEGRTIAGWSWWPDPCGTNGTTFDGDAMDELRSMPPTIVGELVSLMKRLLDGESRASRHRASDTGVRQVTHSTGGVEYRVMFCLHEGTYVVLMCCSTDCADALTQAMAAAEARQKML